MSLWIITFAPVDGRIDDGVRIRGLLKTALRRHGLRCRDLKRVDDASTGANKIMAEGSVDAQARAGGRTERAVDRD